MEVMELQEAERIAGRAKVLRNLTGVDHGDSCPEIVLLGTVEHSVMPELCSTVWPPLITDVPTDLVFPWIV